MEEYYPGSKKTRKDHNKNTQSLDQDTTEVLDLAGGKTFLVAGNPKELFPLGTLARALNRSPVTIRKLEKEGVIPRATMILPSHDERGQRRLYTKEQIEGLRLAAQQEGVLEPNANGKWKAIETTDFRSKALQVFKENK